MDKEIDINFSISVPEPRVASDRGKLSIFIDKGLYDFYHEHNRGKILTSVVRGAIEQALTALKAREENKSAG